MPNIDDNDKKNQRKISITGVVPYYRKVKANNGSIWLTQASQLFMQSKAVWTGISAFIMFISIIPLSAIFMPLIVGGLMIGCSQISPSTPIKFDHLFSGLKNNSRELIILSIIYGALAIIASLVTHYLTLSLGYDMSKLIPSDLNTQNPNDVMNWMQSIDQQKFLITFLLNLLILLALMIPIFMAFWFAPALIVDRKMKSLDALSLSFKACKENTMAFFIYGLVAFGYLMAFFFFIGLSLIIVPPLSFIAFILGYLAAFAIAIISIYTAYVDIFDDPENDSDENRSTSEKTDSPSDSMLA